MDWLGSKTHFVGVEIDKSNEAGENVGKLVFGRPPSRGEWQPHQHQRHQRQSLDSDLYVCEFPPLQHRILIYLVLTTMTERSLFLSRLFESQLSPPIELFDRHMALIPCTQDSKIARARRESPHLKQLTL